MRQTLAIHPGPLGDVVLTIPALRALRARHPADAIVLAGQSRIGELLVALDVVEGHVRFERLGLDQLFVGEPAADGLETVRAAERVVCWFGSRDPGFARRLATLSPGAIVDAAWTPDELVWRHLVASVGAAPAEADRGPVPVPADLVADGKRALEGAGWDGVTPLCIVHPGASGAAKRWSTDGYAEVLGRLSGRGRVAIVVHEGPADHDAVRALRPRLAHAVGTLTNPPLPVLAGALVHARVFLGNDSGISHLAAAVGARGLVLFTSGMRAWEPWSPSAGSLVVSMAGLYREDVDAVSAALARLVP
jgi:ADP-heptose:LPS heptosyltransferase